MSFTTRPLRELLEAQTNYETTVQRTKSAVANSFKSARQQLGLTQSEFAREIGHSQAYVSMVENGSRTPTASMIKATMALLQEQLDRIEGRSRG